MEMQPTKCTVHSQTHKTLSWVERYDLRQPCFKLLSLVTTFDVDKLLQHEPTIDLDIVW